MAHVRRRFTEALEGGDLRAAIAVEKIRKLYRVERAAREAGLDPPATLALRHKESSGVVDGLGRWIADLRGLVRRVLVYQGARRLRADDGIDVWPVSERHRTLAHDALWP